MNIPTIEQRFVRIAKLHEYNIQYDAFDWRDVDEPSTYIETIICRFPLSGLWLREYETDKYIPYLCDVRLKLVSDFIANKFPLRGLFFMSQAEGLTFNDMPKLIQRRLLDTELVLNIIPKSIKQEDARRVMELVANY